jgi:predicted nucleic acid-binding protein
VNGVVADTSVWIEFFAGRDSDNFELALRHGRVVLPPVVVAELMSGVIVPRQRRQISSVLRSLPLHPTPFAHWGRVGLLRRRLRRKGFTVSTPDAHVAQCALEPGGLLLTRDAIFTKIAVHCRLKLL